MIKRSAETQTCTGDARLFRPALYYLSYLGNKSFFRRTNSSKLYADVNYVIFKDCHTPANLFIGSVNDLDKDILGIRDAREKGLAGFYFDSDG